MKIVYVSNFFNHHQIPLSDALIANKNVSYTFIATEKTSEERISLGFIESNNSRNYIIRAYENSTEREKAINECKTSDILIVGWAPLIYDCIKPENAIVFHYLERCFKSTFWPKNFAKIFKFFCKKGQYKNTYLLAASAYAKQDFNITGNFIGKSYKWGYFPEVKKYESINTLIDSKNKNSILWTGRFIDWKHPEAAITVAERLKKSGYNFALNLIGQGELYDPIKQLIEKKNLADCVKLLGAMSPEKVREHMEHSEIFLFTSDRHEGWGAVLNESMNSGCAVVASNAIGAAPYLIEDRKNGLIYQDGNIEELYEKTKYLLDYPTERKALGIRAYETMANIWNADVATERLLLLAERLKNGEDTPYTEGPCSKA